MEPLDIVVIDDDPTQLGLVEAILTEYSRAPVNIRLFSTPAQALAQIEETPPDLVLTDLLMPELDGFAVLRVVGRICPGVPVVIMTAHREVESAVRIMKAGALDFLMKPLAAPDIHHLLDRILEQPSMANSAEEASGTGVPALISADSRMIEVVRYAVRAADSEATVLLLGESGTGKELIAQAIHRASRRASRPFVAVNIAALTETLVESELFGHRKGAFTGATEEHAGRLAAARGGTLFIDEAGDIPAAVQPKLLRTLQNGQYERVGESTPRFADVRFIAATHRDLETMVEAGTFRADLFYRLSVIPISIPPLRERPGDIRVLARHFVETLANTSGRTAPKLTEDALQALQAYNFPGNVRELENIIERAVVLCRGGKIAASDIVSTHSATHRSGVPAGTSSSGTGSGERKAYNQAMDEFEKGLLQKALEDAGGNQSQAARLLEMSERRLRYRMEKLGLRSESVDV